MQAGSQLCARFWLCEAPAVIGKQERRPKLKRGKACSESETTDTGSTSDDSGPHQLFTCHLSMRPFCPNGPLMAVRGPRQCDMSPLRSQPLPVGEIRRGQDLPERCSASACLLHCKWVRGLLPGQVFRKVPGLRGKASDAFAPMLASGTWTSVLEKHGPKQLQGAKHCEI